MRTKIPPAVVSKQLPAILKTLNAPAAAWWEIDGALLALGRCEPADIRSQMTLIAKFAHHPEWYLREGAFWAIVGLHQTITGPEFQMLADIYARERHVFARSSYDAGFRVILKNDQAAFSRADELRVVRTLGQTTHSAPIALGYGTGGVHEAAHRTMMILNHFEPRVFAAMVPDLVAYLENWEPYYQHSVWLVTGSKWQPGILKILDDLGSEARPLVQQLKAILSDYGRFDPNRIGGDARNLEKQISEAVSKWEIKVGMNR